MKGISARDENTAKFVEHFTGVRPNLNLDPVLVYDFEKEVQEGLKYGTPTSLLSPIPNKEFE